MNVLSFLRVHNSKIPQDCGTYTPCTFSRSGVHFLLLLFVVCVIPDVRADFLTGVIVGSALSAPSPANPGQAICVPPYQFAMDTQCNLEFYSKNSLNKFDCCASGSFNCWVMIGDCKGNVSSFVRVPQNASMEPSEPISLGVGVKWFVLVSMVVLGLGVVCGFIPPICAFIVFVFILGWAIPIMGGKVNGSYDRVCADSEYAPFYSNASDAYSRSGSSCYVKIVSYFETREVCRGGFLGIGQSCYESDTFHSEGYTSYLCFNLKTGESC